MPWAAAHPPLAKFPWNLAKGGWAAARCLANGHLASPPWPNAWQTAILRGARIRKRTPSREAVRGEDAAASTAAGRALSQMVVALRSVAPLHGVATARNGCQALVWH